MRLNRSVHVSSRSLVISLIKSRMEEPDNLSESSNSERDFYEDAHNTLRRNSRVSVLPTTPRRAGSQMIPDGKNERAPQTPHAKHATIYSEIPRIRISKIQTINIFDSLKALSHVLASQEAVVDVTGDHTPVSSGIKEQDESIANYTSQEHDNLTLREDNNKMMPSMTVSNQLAGPLVPETTEAQMEMVEDRSAGHLSDEPQIHIEVQHERQTANEDLQVTDAFTMPDSIHSQDSSSPQNFKEDGLRVEDQPNEDLHYQEDVPEDIFHPSSIADESIALGTKSDFADTSLQTDLISLSSGDPHQENHSEGMLSNHTDQDKENYKQFKEEQVKDHDLIPQDQDNFDAYDGQYDDISDNDPSYKPDNKRSASVVSDYSEEEILVPSDFAVTRPIVMDDISFIQPSHLPVKKVKRRNRMAKPINPGSTGPARRIAKSLKLETAIPRAVVRDLVHTVSGAKLAPDAFEEIINVSNMFFEQTMKDLADIAEESDRSLIKPMDAIKLLEAQKLTDSKATPFSIAHKYLPAELLNTIISDVN